MKHNGYFTVTTQSVNHPKSNLMKTLIQCFLSYLAVVSAQWLMPPEFRCPPPHAGGTFHTL